MRIRSLTSFIATLLLITSCGAFDRKKSSESDKTPQPSRINGEFKGQKYTRSLEVSDDSQALSGSGLVEFVAPFPGVESDKGVRVRFTLEEKGSLAVNMFDDHLLGAIKLAFTRENSSLNVTVSSNSGLVTKDISDKFTDINAAGEIDLAIDVHNKEPHVLVWKADSHKCEGMALYNSEDHGGVEEKGKGTFWGLGLTNARVTLAEPSDPFMTHSH